MVMVVGNNKGATGKISNTEMKSDIEVYSSEIKSESLVWIMIFRHTNHSIC